MKKKQYLVIILIIILFLIGVGFFFYFYKKSDDSQNNLVDFERNDGELVKVFENGLNSTFEGDKLPEDIDFEEYLPKLPPTSELISVIDNVQGQNRYVSVRFIIYRNYEETKTLIFDELRKKDWSDIRMSEDNIVEASKQDVNVYVDFSDKQKTYVETNFVFNFQIHQGIT